ncbi:uncharacterized protein [Watersipora subatra]|uniref:uncharacterized protein n=1 Tax=Watersipora subatra TaxID=2589382 RepID=UPI00355B397E
MNPSYTGRDYSVKQDRDGQSIEFAAKSLTPTRCLYGQVEKEMLAIQFGLTRFHQYVYGKNVTVDSDHQPLVSINRKPDYKKSDLPSTLQRMRMQRYQYKVSRAPGKHMYISDYLSKSCRASTYLVDLTFEDPMPQICAVRIESAATNEDIEATSQDDALRVVMRYVRLGWPSKKRQCQALAKPYWQFRLDISLYEGLLFYGDRSIIPSQKQAEIIDHYGQARTTRSDNGPQYSSRDIREFAAQYGISHITSSPGYARSNGQVERAIQTVKQLTTKTIKDGHCFWNTLQMLQNTPLASNLPSPAQLLQGRTLFEGIPTQAKCLFPRAYNREEVRANFEARQRSMKANHDSKKTPKRIVLSEGRPVCFRSQKGNWEPAIIKEHHTQARSHSLENKATGIIIRRNRVHLKPDQSQFMEESEVVKDPGPVIDPGSESKPITETKDPGPIIDLGSESKPITETDFKSSQPCPSSGTVVDHKMASSAKSPVGSGDQARVVGSPAVRRMGCGKPVMKPLRRGSADEGEGGAIGGEEKKRLLSRQMRKRPRRPSGREREPELKLELEIEMG